MSIAALLLALVPLQDEDPVKAFGADLEKRLKSYERFTTGALGETIRFTMTRANECEGRGQAKSVPAILEAGADAICKAVLAMESRPTDLRRALGHLDKARKRAAGLEADGKKASALRYGLQRAFLVWEAEANGTVGLFNLALDLAGTGDYDEAEEALKEVEERLPALQESQPTQATEAPRLAAIFLGRLFMARGQYKEGAAALRRGLDRSPEWGDRELDLKKLHRKEGEYGRILKDLDEHLQKNADDADALLLRAHELFFSADRAKAKPMLEAILKKNGADKHARYFLERLGDGD